MMNGKVTYRQHVSFCGKPGCRKCREGVGHGPYWYAYQTVDGRTVRTYIGKQLPPDVRDSEESSPSDMTSFENLLDRAHAASNPQEKERLLEEAMALYGRETILVEHSTARSQPEREALRHKWIRLLLELADLRITCSALSSAIDVLDRVLAIEPVNEAAVQRLMITLAQLKRRGEALRAYQRFASTLQVSYQMVPSPETQALFESIQKGIVPSSASVYRRGDAGGRP
jgi:tetratricopeptide (TPR) repeat protein